MPAPNPAPVPDVSALLRPGLLEGVSLLLAGGTPAARPGASAPAAAPSEAGSLVELVGQTCGRLGAAVSVVALPAGPEGNAADDEALEALVLAALAERGVGLDLLFVDGGELLSAGDRDGLRFCLEGVWAVTRAAVNGAFLAQGMGGRIVYAAPQPAAGEHAGAARAALENLARTLSIEWARHGVTAVAIAPGGACSDAELAALVAYLASPAGAYFSGCVLEIGRPEA